MNAPKLTDEITLISKIRSLGIECNAFDGLTTPEQRAERVRQAMEPVADVTFSVVGGKRVTVAMKFAEIYGFAP